MQGFGVAGCYTGLIKPTFLQILAGVSLLLGLGAGIMWVRSYDVAEAYVGHTQFGHWMVSTVKGGVSLHWEPLIAYPQRYYGHHVESLPLGTAVFPSGIQEVLYPVLTRETFWNEFGFSIARNTWPGGKNLQLWLPHWSVMLAAMVLPAYALLKSRRPFVLLSAGRCPDCGYDMRATPDRCPECGTRLVRNV